MRRAEAQLERAVERGFKPLMDFLLRNWERELPLSAVVASENLESLPEALRFSISDAEWERFSPEMAREIASALGVSLEMGAEAGRSDLVGILVDWSLQSPEAIEWMRSWSLDLVKGLQQTTRDELRNTLAAGLELGESRDELAKRVQALVDDIPAWRSRLIAQSETIRAYSQGSLQVYRASGVTEKKEWLDGQANACPDCQALDGQIVGLEENFEGGVDAPPLHPGCRCSTRGIVAGAKG